MAKNAYEDLSGLPTLVTEPHGNPFDPLITACNNDPVWTNNIFGCQTTLILIVRPSG